MNAHPRASQTTLTNSLIYLGLKMAVFSRLATAVQLFSIILTPALCAATSKDYDYVIVGGGVTGLVVANRLTEDKRGELQFWLMYNQFNH